MIKFKLTVLILILSMFSVVSLGHSSSLSTSKNCTWMITVGITDVDLKTPVLDDNDYKILKKISLHCEGKWEDKDAGTEGPCEVSHWPNSKGEMLHYCDCDAEESD